MTDYSSHPVSPASKARPAPGRVACLHCDQLLQVPPPWDGQRLRCSRCLHVLTDHTDGVYQRSLALAIAALVLLCSLFFFPMIEIRVQGVTNSLTLLDCALMLFAQGNVILGTLMLLLLIVLPVGILFVLMLLTTLLSNDRPTPVAVALARLFFRLRRWNMIEVYLIGTIVSLTKLVDLAFVDILPAFWALLLFSVFFLASVYGLDRYQVFLHLRSQSAGRVAHHD